MINVLFVVTTLAIIVAACWAFAEATSPIARTSKPRSSRPRSEKDRLRAALQAAVAEQAGLRRDRDKWQQTAEASALRVRELEAVASRFAPAGPNDPSHFRRLRALIATEFHPDHVKTEGIDRFVRQEIFKSLWPKVQQIEAS